MQQKNPMLFLTAPERPRVSVAGSIPLDIADKDLAKMVFDDDVKLAKQAHALWRGRHPADKIHDEQLHRIAHVCAYAEEIANKD